MPSPLDTLDVSPSQGTTGEKPLTTDDLLALRALFVLLDAWDRSPKNGDSKTLHAVSLPIAGRDVIQKQPNWPVEGKGCAK